MKYLKLIVLSSLLVLLGACNKYEEGSNFSLISAKNRLVNTWTLTKYEINGSDETASSPGLEMVFYKDETFKRSYIVFGVAIPEEGKWSFADSKKRVILTKENGDLEIYTIVQLKNKDLKAKREENGVTHVYTFKGK